MNKEKELRASRNGCIFTGVVLLIALVMLVVESFDGMTAMLCVGMLAIFLGNVTHYRSVKKKYEKHDNQDNQ